MIKTLPEKHFFTPVIKHWVSFNVYDKPSSYVILTGPHCLYDASAFDPGGSKYPLNLGYTYGAPKTLHPIKYGDGYLTPYAVLAMHDGEISYEIISPPIPTQTIYTSRFDQFELFSPGVQIRGFVHQTSNLERIKIKCLARLELDKKRHCEFLMEKHFSDSSENILQSYGTIIVNDTSAEVYNGEYWIDIRMEIA